MMKRLFVLLFGLALVPGIAQAQQVRKATLFYQFDVDSGTVNYPLHTGLDNSPFSSDRTVTTAGAKISTVGSSTTVTATVAATLPFALLGVGDAFGVKIGTDAVPTYRIITAKASGDSVTVNAAIDLSVDATGYFFTWRKYVGGTAATSGWFDVSNLAADTITITVQYDQGDLDALGVRWECRVQSLDTQPQYVHPGASTSSGICGPGTPSATFCTFATAGAGQGLSVRDIGKWDECRIGLKFVTNDTSDAGANLEKVTATIVGVIR
jgi:hypothetical protein